MKKTVKTNILIIGGLANVACLIGIYVSGFNKLKS
jgi:hypothetical protein